jgi:hypothetical protein
MGQLSKMTLGPAAIAGFVVAALAAATVWGLAVSVGSSGPAIRESELPDAGFERQVGERAAVAHASWGSALDEVGVSYEGEAWGPSAIGVDDRGRLYVLDRVNERVVRYTGSVAETSFPLPGSHFEDLVVVRDRFVVLDRMQGERRALVFDESGARIADLAVDDGVGDIARLVVEDSNVCVECPSANGRALHTIGTLAGGRTDAAGQVKSREGRGRLAGGRLNARRLDRNHVAIEAVDARGRRQSLVRVASKRDVAGILDVTPTRDGGSIVSYAVYREDPAHPDGAKARLVVAKHAEDGTLIGRIESENDSLPEPLRKITVSESGDIYTLVLGEDGMTVYRWTLGR